MDILQYFIQNLNLDKLVLKVISRRIYMFSIWQVQICTQMNVIPLITDLLCYNVIDKVTWITSKNIETGINNYVFVLDSNQIY